MNLVLCVILFKLLWGSISDRQTVKDSGVFFDKLQAEDIILADKGFEISDVLQTEGAYNNIPLFKYGKQFSPEDILKTRAIAKKRIIIERVSGLAKKNKILTDVMPIHCWKLASKIAKICFFMLTFPFVLFVFRYDCVP